MNEKEMIEEIFEMKKHINRAFDIAYRTGESDIPKAIAEELIQYYQPKIPEGSVVFQQKDLTKLQNAITQSCNSRLDVDAVNYLTNTIEGQKQELKQARREMVKEILTNIDLLQENLNKKIEQLKEPFRRNMNSKQKEGYKEGILAAKSIISSFKYNIAKQFGVGVK